MRVHAKPRAGYIALLIFLAALLAAPLPLGASGPDADGRGLAPATQLGMLRMALQEYREGVVGGVVVDAHELDTAERLLDELSASVPSAELSAIRGLVARRASRADVEAALAVWVASYGAGIKPPQPSLAPSLSQGRRLFGRYCSACHGDNGDGRGPLAAGIEGVKPVDFSDQGLMAGETPEEFFQAITIGVPGTAMPSWDTVLTAQERWDLVAHLWMIRTPDIDNTELESCSSCHVDSGGLAPLDKSDGEVLLRLINSRVHVREAVVDAEHAVGLARRMGFVVRRQGEGQGTEVEPRHVLVALRLVDEEYRDAVADGRVINSVEYGETRLFLGSLLDDLASLERRGRSVGDEAGRLAIELQEAVYAKADPAEVSRLAASLEEILAEAFGGVVAGRGWEEVRDLLARAQAETSPSAASALVLDAYMAFEPLEKRLAVRDAGFTAAIEADFLALRSRISAGHNAEEDFERLGAGLVRAEGLLASGQGVWAAFANALLIILREGLEAILIISALAAYLGKGGHLVARRWLYEGAMVGIVASLLTALAFEALLGGLPLGQEALEGITMLLAAAVLFSVSYWLISKLEARHWQAYIRNQLDRALGRGSRLAMAGVAFLAVYREGFETVLFYRALVGEAGAVTAVGAGFVLGCLLLVVVYVAIARFSVAIPLRQFFSITGGLLYLLAFRFTGTGIAELQEAGMIAVTEVAWWPRLSVLSMAPNLETALAQMILVVAALVGVVVIVVGGRRQATA